MKEADRQPSGSEGPRTLDPVVEAYKKDLDRTLLAENLKLSVEERFRKLMALQRFAEEPLLHPAP